MSDTSCELMQVFDVTLNRIFSHVNIDLQLHAYQKKCILRLITCFIHCMDMNSEIYFPHVVYCWACFQQTDRYWRTVTKWRKSCCCCYCCWRRWWWNKYVETLGGTDRICDFLVNPYSKTQICRVWKCEGCRPSQTSMSMWKIWFLQHIALQGFVLKSMLWVASSIQCYSSITAFEESLLLMKSLNQTETATFKLWMYLIIQRGNHSILCFGKFACYVRLL